MGGAALHLFRKLDSTNSWALLNLNMLNHGDVVQAQFQTAGHGRFARTWSAPQGKALLVSVVLDGERFAPDMLPWVTLSGAIAICNMLIARGLEATLKWPNDVLSRGRKIAGILAEAASDIPKLVLGMGINVNQSRTDIPDGLRSSATSMRQETRKNHSLSGVRALVLDHLARTLVLVEQKKVDLLMKHWREHDCHVGSIVNIRTNNENAPVEYHGINRDGSLKVRRADGSEVSIWSGDVTLASR